MPGPRPRSSPMARLSSSVRRGAPVGGGQLGVYRVQRAATQRPAGAQQPRSSGADLWSSATHFYYADAGLWLGGDFKDLAGYPTALPADAFMLEFVILPPGDDPGDESYTAPWADYNIYDAPPITHDHFEDGATPDAGSHLWVLWWGPNGLVSLDPAPSTADPMSLVPAVLAADGTA